MFCAGITLREPTEVCSTSHSHGCIITLRAEYSGENQWELCELFFFIILATHLDSLSLSGSKLIFFLITLAAHLYSLSSLWQHAYTHFHHSGSTPIFFFISLVAHVYSLSSLWQHTYILFHPFIYCISNASSLLSSLHY